MRGQTRVASCVARSVAPRDLGARPVRPMDSGVLTIITLALASCTLDSIRINLTDMSARNEVGRDLASEGGHRGNDDL